MSEWKLFIPGTYIEPEKFSLTSWTILILRIWNNKNYSKLSSIRPWISLCLRIDVQRYQEDKLNRELIPAICISFFKTCGRTNFPCKWDPHHLVASVFGSPELLALQRKTQSKNLFPDIERTIKYTLGSILEKVT